MRIFVLRRQSFPSSTWCCCGMCLLYFSQEDRSAVFRDVYRHMATDGYLLLGNAEQAEESTSLFEVEFSSSSYFYRPLAGR